MKYRVKTYALYTDTVEVEADSEIEALDIAHEEAEYQYESWFEAIAEEVQEEEL